MSSTKQHVGITGKSRRIGVQGMGGIGKTVLATALARDEEVRKAFPDGVFWVTFGQTPQILTWQSYLAQTLGDLQAAFTEIGLAKARLRELFADKTCLLILDDIWRLNDTTPFDVLGERCQLLFTTRNAAIVTGLGGEEYQLGVLNAQQALALLADWAFQPEIRHPTNTQNDVVLQVARECGYLPLALAMVGAMMRGKPSNRWQNILEKLHSADLEKIKQQFSDYPYPDLLRAIAVSVEALDENCRQRYLDFAVFKEDTPIPEVVLQTFWQPLGLDEFDSQDIIDELVIKSLALRDELGSLRLHDLQFDYVRKQHRTLAKETEEIEFLHNRLLNGYSEKYLEGWHSLENDGYILQNLAYHLLAGGRERELQQLLCDFRWLQAKLENTNVNALIADYDFLPENENLRLIQGALRLSAHILNQDKQQLSGQLLGRLLGFEAIEIQTLLTQAQQSKTTCLVLQSPSLTPPGGPLIRTLSGHSYSVNALALTPDGKHLVSGSWDGTLKVWSLEAGVELFTIINYHSRFEKVVTITPDGKRVIFPSRDNTLKVWNLETNKELLTLTGHKSTVETVIITPDGKRVISASHDNTLKVWNLETGVELFTIINYHSKFEKVVTITPNGKQLIFSSDNSTLKVWDLEAREELFTLISHNSKVKAVAITPDGKRLISGSYNNIEVWELATKKKLLTLIGCPYWVMVVTPDGKRVIYQADKQSSTDFKVCNLVTGEELCRLTGYIIYCNHPGYVVTVTLDSKKFIANASERTLKVWDLETGQGLLSLTGHTDRITAVAVHPNSKQVISGSRDKTIKIWDLEVKQELSSRTGHIGAVNTVAITPDGKRVITGSKDGTIKVWNLETKQEIFTISDHIINALAVTPDGKRVISASGDTLKVWDLKTGAELLTLIGHNYNVEAVTVTLDGKKVISSSRDQTLKVWNLETGEELFTLTGHTDVVTVIAVMPDNKRVISVSGSSPYKGPEDHLDGENYTLKIWDLKPTEEIFTFTGDPRTINSVAVTSDGKWAVYGTDNQDNINLIVLDLETGGEPFALAGHSSSVNGVAITPNGNLMISASDDCILRVWNLSTGEVVASFIGESQLNCCAVTVDGLTIVAGDNLGRVHFLQLAMH